MLLIESAKESIRNMHNNSTKTIGVDVEVNINGEWKNILQCKEIGIEVSEQRSNSNGHDTSRIFLNNMSASFSCGGFRWRKTNEGDNLLNTAGKDLRLYLEGWSMSSACGSKKYGECDFSANPDYKRYAICCPESHISNIESTFRAEHLIVINNCTTKQNLLIGFLTSGRMFGRFDIKVDEEGLGMLDIINDCDGILVATGDRLESETVCFKQGQDAYSLLEEFAELWGQTMSARISADLPTGWCSWYYYFDKIREVDMLENIAYMEKNRADYPVKYIQLDDGYQSALGDWLVWNDKFPGGYRYLADSIKNAGFKPAIWVAPFLVDEKSSLMKEHPEWMVQDVNGDIDLEFSWRENHKVAILDGTNPEVIQHFITLFQKLRDAGYEYVKLDFLAQGAIHGKRYDSKATRCQALRQGMEAIRKGFGETGFILGCTAPLGSLVGVVDGQRIAPDIAPYWSPEEKYYDEAPCMPNVCRNGINRSYMHRRLWLNDPDTHIARTDNNKMKTNEVDLWTNALRMIGGLLLLSDRFATLIPERSALSRLLLSSPDEFCSRPLDFLERSVPTLWLGTSRVDGRKLLGIFNFEDKAQEFVVDVTGYGLSGLYIAEENSSQGYELLPDEWHQEIPAHSCRLYDLRFSE